MKSFESEDDLDFNIFLEEIKMAIEFNPDVHALFVFFTQHVTKDKFTQEVATRR